MNETTVQRRYEELMSRLNLFVKAKAPRTALVSLQGVRLPPVEVQIHTKGRAVDWVTVRAPGQASRSVFPTKVPTELPKAVVRNVLLAILDMAAGAEAGETLGEAAG